jgi:hypothetical protein
MSDTYIDRTLRYKRSDLTDIEALTVQYDIEHAIEVQLTEWRYDVRDRMKEIAERVEQLGGSVYGPRSKADA